MNEARADYLPINKLHPFEGHPFKVTDNEEMDQLTWSILTQGLLTPLVARPLDNGDYEVISGHRRLHACKKAGIETVPVLIYAIDRDAAAIALVDSNLHREHILPSEKAFAYKLKAEALNHRGQRTDLTSVQLAPKLATEQIAEAANTSKDTVKRYIRLTYLLPELLEKVDEGKSPSPRRCIFPIFPRQNKVGYWMRWNATIAPRLLGRLTTSRNIAWLAH